MNYAKELKHNEEYYSLVEFDRIDLMNRLEKIISKCLAEEDWTVIDVITFERAKLYSKDRYIESLIEKYGDLMENSASSTKSKIRLHQWN